MKKLYYLQCIEDGLWLSKITLADPSKGIEMRNISGLTLGPEGMGLLAEEAMEVMRGSSLRVCVYTDDEVSPKTRRVVL